jgi:hypothetical protein
MTRAVWNVLSGIKAARIGPLAELEQRANLFGTQIIGHSNLKIERRTSNVQYRIGSWTSNLKFQIVKIEQA